MPGDIARRSTSAFALRTSSARQSRELTRALEGIESRAQLQSAQIQADALAASTRVQATAFVAQTALNVVAALSVEEARLAAQVPHALPRLSRIVDRAAAVAANEVTRLGWPL